MTSSQTVRWAISSVFWHFSLIKDKLGWHRHILDSKLFSMLSFTGKEDY